MGPVDGGAFAAGSASPFRFGATLEPPGLAGLEAILDLYSVKFTPCRDEFELAREAQQSVS